MSEYGYIPESPEQSPFNNKGIFTPNDIYDLVRLDKWTPELGQLELIETQSVSGVSTFDFTDLKDYKVHFLTYNDLFNSDTAKGFAIRLYENDVLETGSVYLHAHQDCRADGSFAENRSTGASQWQFANNTSIGTHARSRANGFFYFYNLLESSKYSFATSHTTGLNNSNTADFRFGSWVLPQASYVNKIQFMAYDAGNITGTFSLYGIKAYS
jgi:hypothetical protein